MFENKKIFRKLKQQNIEKKCRKDMGKIQIKIEDRYKRKPKDRKCIEEKKRIQASILKDMENKKYV